MLLSDWLPAVSLINVIGLSDCTLHFIFFITLHIAAMFNQNAYHAPLSILNPGFLNQQQPIISKSAGISKRLHQ